MENWKYTSDSLPLSYKTGDWDGKKSDPVLVKDNKYNPYVAVLYEGFMDGVHFKEWYTLDDYEIKAEVIKWMDIPE